MPNASLFENIQREYCIFGMRRSGQHAIARWILRQLPGRSLFLNDLEPKVNVTTLRPPDKRRLDHCYREGHETQLPASAERIDSLVYNHEDCPFTVPPPQSLRSTSNNYHVILVLRESFNIFASRYFFWVRMNPNAPRWRWDDTDLWANHANRYLQLNRQRPARITTILLERWQTDADYRQHLAERLELEFTDAGHKDVSHIGSTFDLHRFAGQADNMPIHNRWSLLVDVPDYRQVLTRPEIAQPNKLLFPDHPALKQISQQPMSAPPPTFQSINALLQAGDFTAAHKEAVRLCHIEPDNLQAWYGLAAISAQLGALDDVVSCCQRILTAQPNNPAVLYNLGTALLSLKRHSEAIQVYANLIAHQPDNAAALANLAAAHHGAGDFAQAITHAERALALDANLHQARNTLGLAHFDSGNIAAAEIRFRQQIALTPNAGSAYYNLGLTLMAGDDAINAVTALQRAVLLQPANADVHVELAKALHKSGDSVAAFEAAQHAVAQFPKHAGAHDVLGNRYAERGDLNNAHTVFERARVLAPHTPDILCHLGNSHLFRGEVASALACYDEALQAQPDHAQSHWQRAWCLLLLGQLAEGWQEYAWRFQAGIAQLPGYTQPQWQGETLEGRRILLFGEQGFGDSLQFIRYATQVKQRGARQVIVQCRAELMALFATCPGVDVVIDETEPAPAFDVQAPLLSLPQLFNTVLETIPAGIPYLSAPADRSAPQALINAPGDKLKIGITWCGNPEFRWNKFRSCTLADFAPLAQRTDVQLFSLQKGAISEALHTHGEFSGIIDLGGAFHDFAATAAAMQQLDLIITTDTSVVHLAGALGRETWLLLSYAADWRWLLERADSPWYPSLRLFRQPTPGDWNTPLRAIIQALELRLRDA